jgi:hypothetical protein
MSGFNIHTGLPIMHGGMTGYGLSSAQKRGLEDWASMGITAIPGVRGGAYFNNAPRPMHSLGGYLIGGAKLDPANFASEDEYNRAYQNQKLNKKIYSGQKKLYARGQLKDLIDAESWAARTAMDDGNLEYANLLSRDYKKDMNLLRKKSLPAWAASEYAYGKRFAPPREPMSQTQKERLKYNAMVKKLQRERGGVGKIINPKTGKMVYVDSAIGQRILKAAQTLGEFGRSSLVPRDEPLYSSVSEVEENPLATRSQRLAYARAVKRDRARMYELD